jgi:hypothetical protein
LITILYLGGKITQASNHLSHMLNGVEYYSLEVTLNGDHYLIQAFEQEAADLFDVVMSILDEKETVKFSDHTLLIFLVDILLFLV